MLFLFKTFSGLVYHAKFKLFLLISSIVFLLNTLAILEYVRDQNLRKVSGINLLTMLDVGQGDSFLVELSSLHTVLIDTGNDHNKFREAMAKRDEVGFENQSVSIYRNLRSFLNKYFFNYSRKTIDLVIITHDDSDHVGVLNQVTKTYKVGLILTSPLKHTYIDKLKRENKEAKVERIGVKGLKIEFNEKVLSLNSKDSKRSAEMSFLFPEVKDIKKLVRENVRSANGDSLIFKLSFATDTHAPVIALFTGDAGVKEERKVIQNLKEKDFEIDILKVGHHGSKTSTSNNLLKVINPKYALISAGKNNSYGHPNKQVMNNLRSHISEDRILRTDICGTLKIEINKNGTFRHRSCDL